jgi:hypothetical protein
MEALRIELGIAQLPIGRGTGHLVIGEFETKVVGEALVLVLSEFTGGVRGGPAAIQL